MATGDYPILVPPSGTQKFRGPFGDGLCSLDGDWRLSDIDEFGRQKHAQYMQARQAEAQQQGANGQQAQPYQKQALSQMDAPQTQLPQARQKYTYSDLRLPVIGLRGYPPAPQVLEFPNGKTLLYMPGLATGPEPMKPVHRIALFEHVAFGPAFKWLLAYLSLAGVLGVLGGLF